MVLKIITAWPEQGSFKKTLPPGLMNYSKHSTAWSGGGFTHISNNGLKDHHVSVLLHT